MRWGPVQSAFDSLNNALNILDHIIVPESNHLIAMAHEFPAPRFICSCLRRMLASIELDYELARWAGKIGDEAADRMLTPEPPGQRAFT